MLQNYIDIQFLPFEFAVILKYEIINLLLWWMFRIEKFLCVIIILVDNVIFLYYWFVNDNMRYRFKMNGIPYKTVWS